MDSFDSSIGCDFAYPAAASARKEKLVEPATAEQKKELKNFIDLIGDVAFEVLKSSDAAPVSESSAPRISIADKLIFEEACSGIYAQPATGKTIRNLIQDHGSPYRIFAESMIELLSEFPPITAKRVINFANIHFSDAAMAEELGDSIFNVTQKMSYDLDDETARSRIYDARFSKTILVGVVAGLINNVSSCRFREGKCHKAIRNIPRAEKEAIAKASYEYFIETYCDAEREGCDDLKSAALFGYEAYQAGCNSRPRADAVMALRSQTLSSESSEYGLVK